MSDLNIFHIIPTHFKSIKHNHYKKKSKINMLQKIINKLIFFFSTLSTTSLSVFTLFIYNNCAQFFYFTLFVDQIHIFFLIKKQTQKFFFFFKHQNMAIFKDVTIKGKPLISSNNTQKKKRSPHHTYTCRVTNVTVYIRYNHIKLKTKIRFKKNL